MSFRSNNIILGASEIEVEIEKSLVYPRMTRSHSYAGNRQQPRCAASIPEPA